MSKSSKNKEFFLPEFNMNMLPIDGTIVLQGKRRSGKSVLARDILYHLKDKIGGGIVVSGTEGISNPFYSDFVPPILISNAFDEKRMNTVIKNIGDMSKIRTKSGITEKRPQDRTFIILDDIMNLLTKPDKSEALRTIFFNGRHYGIFFMITLQYLKGLSPNMRSNVDTVFLFKTNALKELKEVYETYAAGIFETFDIFKKYNQTLPENHCMVLMSSRQGNDENAFIYKADINIPPFKLCSQEYWEYSEKNMIDPLDESDEDSSDSDSGTGSGSKHSKDQIPGSIMKGKKGFRLVIDSDGNATGIKT